jgi:hypothetical protein
MLKLGICHLFVGLVAHVRVSNPINGYHPNAKLCMNIDALYFGKK